MDFRDSQETSVSETVTDTVETPVAPKVAAPEKAVKAKKKIDTKTVAPRIYPVEVDHSRDALLTEFGKDTLRDRYLLPGENFQDLFVRVASAYADDAAHAQRIYDYISRLWFMPATPVLSNGGTGRGLPISCFLNSVPDSLNGIVDTWNENVWLASRGGGIGTYWGNVRGIGEPVGLNGKTSGIIPFVRVMDSLTLAISQGSLRRGSAACYLDISHPEIEEFLEIRKPSGDFNRKALNLHHGVLIPDAFMEAVRSGADWDLKSPKDGSVRATVNARALFQKLVETRLATGEPYIVFADHVNNNMPKHHRDLGLKGLRTCAARSLCPLARITSVTSARRSAASPRSTLKPGISGRTRRALSRTSCASSTTSFRTISTAPSRAWKRPPIRPRASAASALA